MRLPSLMLVSGERSSFRGFALRSVLKAAFALLLVFPSDSRPVLRRAAPGMRVYHAGRYQSVDSTEIKHVDGLLRDDHQVWRKNCSLVALVETRGSLPGDAAKWSQTRYYKGGYPALTYGDLPFPTIIYYVNWHDAHWSKVAIVAEINQESLPQWSRKITLWRSPGGVYWVTGVRKLMPER